MDVLTFKLLAIALIFLTGILCGLIPLRAGDVHENEIFFSLGNSFAGGIFLGAGLLHLLPDGIERFTGMSGYPFALLLAASSLGLLLFLEKVLFIEREARDPGKLRSGGSFAPFLLAVILSIHSFIAGLALGIEKTLVAGLILFAAIVAHKGSAAFALGISMLKGGVMQPTYIRVILLFSIMTPTGLALGSVVSRFIQGEAGNLMEGIFDSLAAGTFIYVAALDIIEEEFSIPGNEMFKFLAIVFGLGLMALLAIWT